MPFIHVKSLPFRPALRIRAVLKGIADDFAEGAGIGAEHVTVTWDFFTPGHYAVGGNSASRQQEHSHPVLVDLLAPDFNSAEDIKNMLLVVASSISKRVKVPLSNIFINHRQAHAGSVFDAGEIVRW